MSARDRTRGSVQFDRAAEFYDATRGLPPDATDAVADLICREVGDRVPVLDAGVGTGRFALPVAARGVPMVGIDLSRPMLAKLVENAGGRHLFPLALADITRLPFPTGSLGAAVLSHVLHLVPEWQRALDELARVVRRRGLVLVDSGEIGGDMGQIHGQFAAAAGIAGGDDRPGLKFGEEETLDEEMSERGASARVLAPIAVRRTVPPNAVIDLLEQNCFSFTWKLDDETRSRAADATREWAAEHFGALDQPRTFETAIVWRAYDLS